MTLIYAVTGLLWLLLAVCLLVLVALVFVSGSQPTGTERLFATFFVLLLAAPLLMQLRATHRHIFEMTGNRIALDAAGVEIQLGGSSRERKGLPAVPRTHVGWREISAITRQRKTFVYPSLIPFAYPLDVFTVLSEGSAISFTRECIPGAKKIADKIAARASRQITAL